MFGAYPFVGISDESTVAGEDPEGFIVLFDMAEFRNKMGRRLATLSLKPGDELTFKVAASTPRGRKKLTVAPIGLEGPAS